MNKRILLLQFLCVSIINCVYGVPKSMANWLIPQPQEILVGDDYLEYRNGRIICPEINETEFFFIVKEVSVYIRLYAPGAPFIANPTEAGNIQPLVVILHDMKRRFIACGYPVDNFPPVVLPCK